MHPDHLGNIAVRCIQNSLEKDLNIPSRRAASKPLLTLHMRNRCLQFALRYLTGVLITGKSSCRMMNLPFSACPATNKGHLGAKNDHWILPVSRYYRMIWSYLLWWILHLTACPKNFKVWSKPMAILPSGVLFMYNSFVWFTTQFYVVLYWFSNKCNKW